MTLDENTVDPEETQEPEEGDAAAIEIPEVASSVEDGAEAEAQAFAPFQLAMRQYAALCDQMDQFMLRLPADEFARLSRGCGACERQTPLVYGLEAHFAAAHLDEDGPAQDRILARRRTEAWLAQPVRNVRGRKAVASERCPYLMPDGRCLLGAGRPVECRLAMLPEGEAGRQVGAYAVRMMDLIGQFVEESMPYLHNFVLLPAGLFAGQANRAGRNVRKDIRRLKLDARRFTAWPAAPVSRAEPGGEPDMEPNVEPSVEASAEEHAGQGPSEQA